MAAPALAAVPVAAESAVSLDASDLVQNRFPPPSMADTLAAGTGAGRRPNTLTFDYAQITKYAYSICRQEGYSPTKYALQKSMNGPRWDAADTDFLNYTFFPVVRQSMPKDSDVMRISVIPFCCIYSSQRITYSQALRDVQLSQGDKYEVKLRVGGNMTNAAASVVNVDLTFVRDKNARLAIQSSLESCGAQNNSFITFLPWVTEANDIQELKTEGWGNLAFSGSSCGLSVAAAVMGLPPVMYTGYINQVAGPSVGLVKMGDRQGQDAYGYTTVVARASIIENVNLVQWKAVYAALNGSILIIPFSSTYGSAPITEVLAASAAPRTEASRLFGMQVLGQLRALMTTAQLIDGATMMGPERFPIGISTSLADMAMLTEAYWLANNTAEKAAVGSAGRAQKGQAVRASAGIKAAKAKATEKRAAAKKAAATRKAKKGTIEYYTDMQAKFRDQLLKQQQKLQEKELKKIARLQDIAAKRKTPVSPATLAKREALNALLRDQADFYTGTLPRTADPRLTRRMAALGMTVPPPRPPPKGESAEEAKARTEYQKAIEGLRSLRFVPRIAASPPMVRSGTEPAVAGTRRPQREEGAEGVAPSPPRKDVETAVESAGNFFFAPR